MDDRALRLLSNVDINPRQWWTVTGGDINDSYRIGTDRNEEYFVKINKVDRPKGIITTEAAGLAMMNSAGVTNIPQVILLAEDETDACLVMPFYNTSDQPTRAEWGTFMEHLAAMHLKSNEVFGGTDNFIGLLPQINESRNNWVPFFRDNRLKIQMDQALKAGQLNREDEKNFSGLLEKLPQNMPIERPALIHGDLWAGNILPTSNGILMIDPCPYYGHREMDLAMMELFSGVPVREHISSYESVYPLVPGWHDRIELYQLYYLLVHLNLFGSAYLPGVRRIIKKFS